MSKTKKVSLAVASFVMAMVLAVAAFALGGFSPMSESKAADRGDEIAFGVSSAQLAEAVG